MRYLLRLTLLCFALLPTLVQGQLLDTAYYEFPLSGVAGYYSANFGEMRTNHFHSGIDFKTDGREGKPVLAVAEGYVQRIFISPSGYGRALYVAHPNGTTSVYGHLQRFRPDIEAWVEKECRARRQNRLDLYCDSTRFWVERGEEIGRSGNSGTSFGPHLHFEIRESATQRTLNTIAAGVYRPKDQIPPYLFRLHYVALDTLRGVALNSPLRSFEIERREQGAHRLRREEPIVVDRAGYFILEASDRKDEVSNTFGLYRLEGYIDGECFFDYCMEGFSFDLSRYCNAVSYYPLQRNSRNEVLRMAALERTPRCFYRTLRDRGVVRVAEGEERELRIVATDDCGNRSELCFAVRGCGEEQRFRGEVDSIVPIIHCGKHFTHAEDGLRVKIKPGTLYESRPYRQERSTRRLSSQQSLVVLSPLYRVLGEYVPLHRAIELSIESFVPVELREHVALAIVGSRGRLSSLGGTYADGRVTATTSTAGEICVVADTVAPQIEPRFRLGEEQVAATDFSFRLTDNFSGIRRWAAYVDGQWWPLDYQPVRSRATLSLKGLPQGNRQHKVLIRVEDGCGNPTSWEGEIRY